jgi:hypothetical protein
LALALALSAASCNAPTSTNPTVVSIENPNNQAKIVTGAVKIAGQRFLLKNPTYSSQVAAIADALVVVANGNPATLTAQDVQTTVADPKFSLSSSQQLEIAGDITTALDLFETTFSIQFPGLKPNYAIFLDAVANGLYGATGSTATVTLPVIVWPPVTAAPTPTPTPAPSS